jgi:HTH-type transcriptional regulator / antitoxin HigA
MKYKVIKSREQYDQYCSVLEQLLISNASQDEIELLTLLIETWDRDHNEIDEVDNITILRFLMQEHGLRASDLADLLAVGPLLISEFLNNKRVIPLGIAHRLAEHFKLRREVFEGSEGAS